MHSSAPVEFDGPGDRWSPETLLIAAIADCFILTFRAIACATRMDWQGLGSHRFAAVQAACADWSPRYPQRRRLPMNKTTKLLSLATACAFGLAAAAPAFASADLDCKLDYQLTGWSLIYKHTSGTGTVRCSNGSVMRVSVSAKAVGLTAGKWHIDNGHGTFSDVHNINEVLGRYAQASANAGVVKSGEAQVLSKGPVSLALAGGGEGMNIGVDVGAFTIKRR